MDKKDFKFMTFYKVVRDSLTGADNHSFDNGRIICAISFLIYFILAVGSMIKGHLWSSMDFAGGVSTMAVGFGINLKLKGQTEPPPK
jgi:hypothetical protein